MPWFTAIDGGDAKLRCTVRDIRPPHRDTYQAVYTEL